MLMQLHGLWSYCSSICNIKVRNWSFETYMLHI